MEGGQRESSLKQRESWTQIKTLLWSPLTSFALCMKAIFSPEINNRRRLNNTNSALGNLLWEMEGRKPGIHAPLFECFAETKDPDYAIKPLKWQTGYKPWIETACKCTLRFQSNLDLRQEVTRECGQGRKCEQRNLKSLLNKRMNKLAGKHKRFVCYRRGKFKGTGEAGRKQICIAFQCVANEGVKWGEGGLNWLTDFKRGIIFTACT